MTGRWSREHLEATLARFDEAEALELGLAWVEAERHRREEKRPEAISPVSDTVELILSQLGIPSIRRLEELIRRWEEVAGTRWGSQTAPVVVRHGELLVEACDRRIVRRLRLDAGRLVDRIARHFGPGFVTRVRVVSPR